MNIWIDIEDASGIKQGDGPITTATNWTNTRRLDAAGVFSFTMPASDPRASDLAHKRIVRCWTYDANGLKELGGGIIDRITIQPQANGPTMIEVTGDDLLRELANRTVGDLALHKETAYTTASAVPVVVRLEYVGDPGHDPPNWGEEITLFPKAIDLSASGPLTFLYIRYPLPFSKIRLQISSGNTTQSQTYSIQYYNAQDANNTGWETLPNTVDGTANAGSEEGYFIPFAKTGDITFDTPVGWSKQSDGFYTVRISDQTENLTSFTLTQVTVTITEPVTDGLQRIMALAPDGWALDPTGFMCTVDSHNDESRPEAVYMDFAGESVLAALVMLAEQTGNHFTLSPSFRRLRWLGMAKRSSGLRAIQASDTSDNTMLIASLSRSSDSYEMYNRAYAYGGGIGSGRLTLKRTTRTAPPGYALDVDASYLQENTSSAIYGRIDKREDYPDIAPTDASMAQEINAANALFDRVYHALRRKCQLQYAYDVSVIPTTYEVWPGTTIRVVYHEWVESYHAVNIDTALWVLEATQQVNASGVRTVDFVVATVDYWPDNDYRTVSNLIGKTEIERSVDTPATGYTSIGLGTPIGISVRNGQITSVSRITPIDDGQYSNPDYIVVKGGIITAMWTGPT